MTFNKIGKRILVTGTGGSASVNFIRSLYLGYESIHTVGTDTSNFYIKLSKARSNYVIPSCHNKDYIDELNRVIDNEKVSFIHPQPDPEVLVISANRDKINARTFLPSHEAIVLSQNKYKCNKQLKDKNVPVPYTWLVSNKEVLNIAFSSTKDKLWLRSTKGAGSLAALPVTNTEQATMWIDYWTERGITWGQFILSEYLSGKEFAFQSVWKNGELFCSAARERIEYLFQNRMPSGQSSSPTIAKSVHNELVNNIATEAILAIDTKPHGIYCVDLKENDKGVPCVMEINAGRFFTTSYFFASAGSNMPYYYVKLAYDDEINIVRKGNKQVGINKYNDVPANLYWIRQIDCGEILVSEDKLNPYPNMWRGYRKYTK